MPPKTVTIAVYCGDDDDEGAHISISLADYVQLQAKAQAAGKEPGDYLLSLLDQQLRAIAAATRSR